MAEPAWPFVGTEALANGVVNRGRVGKRSPPSSPPPRCTGSLWIDAKLPAELNQRSRHKTKGIVLHSDELGDDEVCIAGAVPATTPARTAFDLGRRNRLTPAVIRLDALMRATHLKAADVEVLIERHRGARGIVSLRKAISLADAGAESPQETRTRLVLTFAGACGHSARKSKSSTHWTTSWGAIDRYAEFEVLGWRIIRISGDMLRYRPTTIVERTRAAVRAAGAPV